jgi:hypothetical protein
VNGDILGVLSSGDPGRGKESSSSKADGGQAETALGSLAELLGTDLDKVTATIGRDPMFYGSVNGLVRPGPRGLRPLPHRYVLETCQGRADSTSSPGIACISGRAGHEGESTPTLSWRRRGA